MILTHHTHVYCMFTMYMYIVGDSARYTVHVLYVHSIHVPVHGHCVCVSISTGSVSRRTGQVTR